MPVNIRLNSVSVAIIAAFYSSSVLATSIINNQEKTVDSSWTDISSTYVGNKTDGQLIIVNGGEVSTAFLNIGSNGATGIVNVTDGGILSVAHGRLSSPFIIGGGSSTTVGYTNNGVGILNISGRGSTVIFSKGEAATTTSNLTIGSGLATGLVTITDGGKLLSNSGDVRIAGAKSSVGTVLVAGSGSELYAANTVHIGSHGKGTAVVSEEGSLRAPEIRIATITGSMGELVVGARDGDTAVAAGVIDTQKIIFGAGTGVLTLNHTSTDFTLDADISGSGTVSALSGTSALTGDNSAFQGEINIDTPAALVISAQNNIGTNEVTMSGGTLEINTAQDWQFINALTGDGTLRVDTAGNRFDFSSPALTSNFSGIIALNNTRFDLDGTNTDALKSTLLKLGSGSVATAGDGRQTIDGLVFDGGTLVMGSIAPGQTTTDNTLHTTGQLDISGSGTVQVTTAGTVSNDTPVPDTSVPLLAQDDGNILVQLVSAEGSVTGSGGNLTLTDQNGNIISDGGVTADISQNGNTVAKGTWDYRLTGGDSNDGLYVNYGLTQVELSGQGSDALVLNSEGRTGSAADLSARLTGSGDLAVDSGMGNIVSLSNLENDYTGSTDIRSGTLLMQNDGVLGTTSLLQMSQGTALEMNGYSQTVGSVDIAKDAQWRLSGDDFGRPYLRRYSREREPCPGRWYH